MIVRVTTPVPGHTGSVGGVHFANGEALVDDEANAAEVAYFRGAGYSVEDVAETVVAEEEPVVDDEAPEADSEEEPEQDDSDEDEPAPMPAKNASTEAWRAWAVEHGGLSTEDAADLTRDQLVERFADSEDNT